MTPAEKVLAEAAAEKLQTALEHLQEQLAWRGPNGKSAGIITMPRAMAELVVKRLEQNKRLEESA